MFQSSSDHLQGVFLKTFILVLDVAACRHIKNKYKF